MELSRTEAFPKIWGAMLRLKGGSAATGGFGQKVPYGHSVARRERGWAGRDLGDPAGATCRTPAGICLKGVEESAPLEWGLLPRRRESQHSKGSAEIEG